MILGSVFSATSTHGTSVSSTLSVLTQTHWVIPHSFSFHSSTDYMLSMREMKLRSWRDDIEHCPPHPSLLMTAQPDSSVHFGWFITGHDILQTLQTGLQAASSPYDSLVDMDNLAYICFLHLVDLSPTWTDKFKGWYRYNT